MGCEILDFQCVFVSEIAGSTFIATLIALVFYFILASKLNWSFTTTAGFLVPIMLISTIAIGGFSAVLAFSTVIIGFLISIVINKFISER